MEKVRLKDICEVVSGTTPKTSIEEYWDGDIDWITPAELKEDSFIIQESVRKITELAVNKSTLKAFPKGTVILSSRAPIGKVAIAGKEMYCNQGFKNLICSDRVSSFYLYWFLKGKTVFLNSLGRGATFKEISKGIVENIEVPLPSLEVQAEISYRLKKCTDIIRLRKEQLVQLDNLIKSRFVEMFGDIVSNSSGWDIDVLNNHLDVIGGFAFKSEMFLDSGIPVLKIGNINAGYLKTTNLMFWGEDEKLLRYEINPGDLVISLTGTVGKDDYGNVCIMGDDYPKYYLNQRNAKLDLKYTLNKHYLTYALKVSDIKKKLTGISRGVRQANISNKDIQNLELPIPPIDIQNQFATFVQAADKLKFGLKILLILSNYHLIN